VSSRQRFPDALDHPECFTQPALTDGPAFGPVRVTYGAIRVEPLDRTRHDALECGNPAHAGLARVH
jgi:hypothetical protein